MRVEEPIRQLLTNWRLADSRLRGLIQWGIAVALVAISFQFLRGLNIDEAASSMLVAAVFGVATVAQMRQSQRRQHTVELLTAFQTADVLPAADTWMARRIADKRSVEADISAEDDTYVITILDYYEFLSSVALRGLVDVPLLLRLRGTTMYNCYNICHGYVTDRRALGDFYQNFEKLVAEFSRRQRKRGRDLTFVPIPDVNS